MKQRVFQVFYRDYAHEVAISSAQPESLLAERVSALAERLLINEDNFLGVIDRNEFVLQLYLQDDGLVAVELLRPDVRDYLRGAMPREQALALLSALPEVFGPELIPGAKRIRDGT